MERRVGRGQEQWVLAIVALVAMHYLHHGTFTRMCPCRPMWEWHTAREYTL